MDTFTPPAPLQTAVLFLVFNRPDTTAQVFEAIRKAKPPRLYVAADGPRANREGEVEKVAKVREIATAVDWPCEVKTLFREENLGCKYAVSGGITWFFEQEGQGIILEDDCLPSQSFFWFCEELLAQHKQNNDIWHISGATVNKNTKSNESYHFSAYPGIWGWATWANRWNPYDVDLVNFREDMIVTISKKYDISKKYWSRLFLRIKMGEIDTWDYQWIFRIWSNGGLSITPNKNLVSNIGFGNEATHTKNVESSLSCMPKEEVQKVVHPANMGIEKKLDKDLKKKYFSNRSLIKRISERIKRL
jgi:hypothetical protein